MKVLQRLRAGLSFTPGPTTVLAVLIYAAVFISVLVTDELPDVPATKKWNGLNLTEAYADLHVIAARPHPYSTHANDLVHDYILERLGSISSRDPANIHVVDDVISNASYAGRGQGVYFEGTNVLVKIDGTSSNSSNAYKGGALLFSAHYDSVSTAPGATDDGMGVVTLIQMVKYFANNRPRKTVVFNFNNGEEDWLNGAHVFLEHPWSNLTTTFVNVEGAAAGGRPLLFRATSLAPTRSFHVAHPHANVLSADAFARGVIRSGTDYSVYEQGLVSQSGTVKPGMEGLDFAFYKGRSKYHTKYDSVAFTEGGRKALWAMMDSVRTAGNALANGKEKTGERRTGAVYFDLFGEVLVAFSTTSLFIVNVILLAAGPILVLAMLFGVIVQARKQHVVTETQPNGGTKTLILALIGWTRFWIALAISILANIGLVAGYVRLNPFAVHSHPIVVLISTLTLSYLTVVLPLSFAHFGSKTATASSARQQKLATIVESYLVTWVLLLVATVLSRRMGLGGFYWVSAWNIVVLTGAAIGLGEALLRVRHGAKHGANMQDGLHSNDDAIPGDGSNEDAATETAATENTPLMHQHRRSNEEIAESTEDGNEIGWWILQMLLLVPVPVILVSQIGILLMSAMGQTLVDGSSAVTVYSGAALLSLIVVLPLAPFAHKMHRFLTFFVAVTFAGSLFYTWTTFPFTSDAPFKVSFQQQYDFGFTPPQAVTSLTGARRYLEQRVIPELPSTWSKRVNCTDDSLRPELVQCTWGSELLPLPGGIGTQVSKDTDLAELIRPAQATSAKDWISVHTQKTSSQTARITIRGVNTRGCKLYFDIPVHAFEVINGSTNGLQPGYEIPEEGVKTLSLWSRTWDREFAVHVGWRGAGDVLRGRAACVWAEYASGSAGVPGSGGRIPALEEVLAFLPKWAAVTKRADALVEASVRFVA